eukprot:13565411-Alexandrium_andersonii.AAC.1
MSASLVGSEMCIRDRPCCRTVRAPRWSPARACGSPAARVMMQAEARWPVSYTHLTLPTICSV